AILSAVLLFAIHHHIAGGVPDLVAEIAEALDAADIELDIPAGGGQGAEGEAQGIGAVGGDAVGEFGAGLLFDLFRQLGLHHAAGALVYQGFQVDAVDQVDGVEDIALGFRHLLALGIPHQAVDVHRLEGDLRGAVVVLDEVHGHHDHPRHPEENDVEAGDQHIRGVEGFEVVGVVRPAEGGEGPQGGAEPGVQHIVVLVQADIGGNAVFFPYLVFTAAHIDLAVVVVPGGNAVAPPQLAADAPVLEIPHPGEVHVLVLFGHELDAAVLHRFDGGFGELFDAHIPLVGEPGFHHGAGAVAPGHLQGVGFDFFQKAQLLEFSDDLLAGLEAVEAGVGLGTLLAVHAGVGVEGEYGEFTENAGVAVQHIDQRQVVALAHLVVVEVVGRGDLHAAGAEVPVHIVVGNDGDQPSGDGQAHLPADQMPVALVLRVHRYGGVAEHGFGTGGGDDQMITGAVDRVAE